MTKPYHIKFSPKAKRQFIEMTSRDSKFLLKFIEALAINPRPPGAKKIEGMTGLHSETVGIHRMIYRIEDQEVLILLIKQL